MYRLKVHVQLSTEKKYQIEKNICVLFVFQLTLLRISLKLETPFGTFACYRELELSSLPHLKVLSRTYEKNTFHFKNYSMSHLYCRVIFSTLSAKSTHV